MPTNSHPAARRPRADVRLRSLSRVIRSSTRCRTIVGARRTSPDLGACSLRRPAPSSSTSSRCSRDCQPRRAGRACSNAPCAVHPDRGRICSVRRCSATARVLRARAAELSFRDLYDNISEGVFRSTLDGRMISANPALVRLNGYETEEELIRGCNDIAREWYVDPNRRAEIHQMLLEGRAASPASSRKSTVTTRASASGSRRASGWCATRRPASRSITTARCAK